MVDTTELHLSSDMRGEIVVDSLGRRRWPDDLKGYLVAQSFIPGVTVREIAERAGVGPNHLSHWRRLAREGKLVVPDLSEAEFVPVEVATVPTVPAKSAPVSGSHPIEVVKGEVTIRLAADTAAARISEIAAAL